jgi:hypothetical protein
VQNCFEAVFHDVAGRDALAMVTGELLENAIKYGHWTAGSGFFRLKVWGDAAQSFVAVTNPVAKGSEDPARVRTVIDFIASKASPAEAYRERLLEVASAEHMRGLGLVRIAYEGECQLSVRVENDELCITAERRVALADASLTQPATH